MHWNLWNIQTGGEKWKLVEGTALRCTIVRLPGTVARVYWRSGKTADFTNLGDALAAVRTKYPAAPELPGVSY